MIVTGVTPTSFDSCTGSILFFSIAAAIRDEKIEKKKKKIITPSFLSGGLYVDTIKKKYPFLVYHGKNKGTSMITYFKVPPESLFPGDCKPKGIKVKTIVFRDDDDACRIDCISLDRFGNFVCYEQWSIAGNKKDYKQCRRELHEFAGRAMTEEDGAGIFADYEKQKEKEALQ